MERIVKIIVSIFLCFVCAPVLANTGVANKSAVEMSQCIKTFPVSYDKLYYLTLSGINENNYSIKELQTKSGYIVFETGNRKYLASIMYVSSAKAMLKITPYSGNYDFPLEVPQSVFKYIETYQAAKF